MSLDSQAQRSPQSVEMIWLVGATPSSRGMLTPSVSVAGLGRVAQAAPTALVIAAAQLMRS
jgi:hypothetical protein